MSWQSRLLTVEHIFSIHKEQIQKFGGMHGCLHPDKVDGVIQGVETLIAYGQITSLFEIAAHYCEKLNRAHAFSDGNKRTAAGAMLMFLKMHNQEVDATDAELAEIILGMASNELGYDDLLEFLYERVGPAASFFEQALPEIDEPKLNTE